MKRIALLILFLILIIEVGYGQNDNESWRKIIPLKSTRKDVEKLLGSPSDKQLATYKTEDANIEVNYSKERCKDNGWNVPADTVLSYRVYSRKILSINTINIDLSKLFQTVDHSGNVYYTDIKNGIQYFADPRMFLNYIRYTPSENDNKLRCKGFPLYNPISETYLRYDTFPLRGNEMDTAMIDNVLREIKTLPDYNGYVIIYLKKGEKRNSLLPRMQRYAYQTSKASPKKLKILFGGYRDKSEAEVFLLPAGYPSPIPTPKDVK
jgi:hypothetical protein